MGEHHRPNLQEQIVGQFFLKAAHTILGARTLQHTRRAPSSQQAQKCWFNLEIEEVEQAAQQLELWRRDTSSALILEIYVQPWETTQQAASGQDAEAAGSAANQPCSGDSLLERWVIADSRAGGRSQLSRSQMQRLDPPSIYKRMVIMLRALYSYVRILPAYRMYRACRRSRGANFGMRYAIRQSKASLEELRRPPEGAQRMQHLALGPVELPQGQVCLWVHCRPASSVSILEQATAPVLQPRIIPDYMTQARPPAGAPRSSLSASLWQNTPSSPANLPQTGQDPGICRASSVPTHNAGVPRRHSWSTRPGASPGRVQVVPVPSQGTTLGFQTPTLSPSQSPGLQQPTSSRPDQQVNPSNQGLHSMQFSPGSLPSPSGGPKSPSMAGANVQPVRITTSQYAGAPGPGQQAVQGRSQAPDRGSVPAQLSPADSASPSNSGRQASAPVRIPGAAGSRVASAIDLRNLPQDSGARQHPSPFAGAAGRAPASAPANSHLTSHEHAHAMTSGRPAAPQLHPCPESGAIHQMHDYDMEQQPSFGKGSSGPLAPATPSPAAGQLAAAPGSSYSSSYPTSGSPQLPFACTPSQHSYASIPDHPTLGDRQASMGVTPSPPISGRGSSALAAVRRRSWSGRASSLGHPDGNPGAGPFGGGAMPGEGSSGGTAGGPSSGSSLMMTRQDSLSSSLLSSSTPRHFGFHAAPLPGAYTSPGGSSGPGQPRHGFRASSEADQPSPSGMDDACESDVLPFALDGDSYSPDTTGVTPNHVTSSQMEADAAVGAFVRLIQEAPPLRASHSMLCAASPGAPTARGQPSQDSGCSAEYEGLFGRKSSGSRAMYARLEHTRRAPGSHEQQCNGVSRRSHWEFLSIFTVAPEAVAKGRYKRATQPRAVQGWTLRA
ncbi:hypothetical protein WJX84_010786 [Apatococcus fuscideae]|uniref:Autophagy-related protein 13 N-terminal domain-containing protein n=1 Tax=Apatococcus fuscideae TaxID=2026836 RepID=A0AAW1T930_9CHLO